MRLEQFTLSLTLQVWLLEKWGINGGEVLGRKDLERAEQCTADGLG